MDDNLIVTRKREFKIMTEVMDRLEAADIDECVNMRDKFTAIVTPSGQ